MTDDEKIQDIIEASEDALLQKIIDRQEGTLGLEELGHPGPVPTQAELKQWERGLDKLAGGRRLAKPSFKGKRLGRAVLLVILAAVLLLAAASALYRPILNWVESVHEKYTQIQAGETAENQVAQWESAYIPEVSPDGFSISDAADLGDVKFIEYANAGGGRITFYQYGPRSSVRIDTEKADRTITAWVGGQTAYLFRKEELSTFYWNQGGCILSIEYDAADIQESEIKAFAGRIQWRP